MSVEEYILRLKEIGEVSEEILHTLQKSDRTIKHRYTEKDVIVYLLAGICIGAGLGALICYMFTNHI